MNKYLLPCVAFLMLGYFGCCGVAFVGYAVYEHSQPTADSDEEMLPSVQSIDMSAAFGQQTEQSRQDALKFSAVCLALADAIDNSGYDEKPAYKYVVNVSSAIRAAMKSSFHGASFAEQYPNLIPTLKQAVQLPEDQAQELTSQLRSEVVYDLRAIGVGSYQYGKH